MPDVNSAAALLEEAIYRPEHMPDALEAAGQALGFDHFALVHSEIERATFLAADRTMHSLQAYAREGWMPHDYRAANVNREALGKLFLDHLAVADDLRLSSAIYHDLYVPHDMAYYAGWRLSVDGAIWIYALARSETKGPVGRAEAATLARFGPVANRALLLARHMREIRVRGMVDGLAAAGVAAILLDDDGKSILVTPEAEALFDADFGVRQGALWSSSPACRADLAMLAAMARGRLCPDLAPNVALHRRNNRRPVLIQPVPVRGVGLDALPGARLLLMLVDLDRDAGGAADDLLRLFGLTQAEADVAILIAAGHDLKAIADLRGAGVETVRVQLKSVFRKLDVHRQSDVMRLVERIGMARRTG